MLMGRNLSSAFTFVPLGFGRLYLAMQDRNQAQAIALHELNKKHVLLDASIWQQNLSIEDNSTSAVPSLEWLLRFNSLFNAFCRQNAEAPIVIYTGVQPHRQAQTMFLVGCHLLMTYSCSVGDLLNISHFIDHDLSMHGGEFTLRDYWGALSTARDSMWVTFKEQFSSPSYESSIDIEEYLHYARSAFVSKHQFLNRHSSICTHICADTAQKHLTSAHSQRAQTPAEQHRSGWHFTCIAVIRRAAAHATAPSTSSSRVASSSSPPPPPHAPSLQAPPWPTSRPPPEA